MFKYSSKGCTYSMGETHDFCIMSRRDDISTFFRWHGSFVNSSYKGGTIGWDYLLSVDVFIKMYGIPNI